MVLAARPTAHRCMQGPPLQRPNSAQGLRSDGPSRSLPAGCILCLRPAPTCRYGSASDSTDTRSKALKRACGQCRQSVGRRAGKARVGWVERQRRFRTLWPGVSNKLAHSVTRDRLLHGWQRAGLPTLVSAAAGGAAAAATARRRCGRRPAIDRACATACCLLLVLAAPSWVATGLGQSDAIVSAAASTLAALDGSTVASMAQMRRGRPGTRDRPMRVLGMLRPGRGLLAICAGAPLALHSATVQHFPRPSHTIQLGPLHRRSPSFDSPPRCVQRPSRPLCRPV